MRFQSLPFEVDYFGDRPGRTFPAAIFFLTHAHADHLHGLGPSFTGRIISTEITSLVARQRTNASSAVFTPLPLNERTKLNLPCTKQGDVFVTLLPTFHCYGACMFLFEGPFGTVLHTGDFRATDDVLATVRPLAGRVDMLFLDCTYCHPDFEFPSLREATRSMLAFIEKARKADQDVDIFIGTDTFGKEELFIAISKQIGERIFLEPERYDLLLLIDRVNTRKHFARHDYRRNEKQKQPNSAQNHNPDDSPINDASRGTNCIKDPLTSPPTRGAIYAVQRWKLSSKRLHAWSSRTGRATASVVCSACEGRSDERSLPGDVCRVLYSSHSNFSELRMFVKTVAPRRVSCTPETGGYDAQDGRTRDPMHWFPPRKVSTQVGTARKRKRPAAPKAIRCLASAVFAKASRVRQATGARFVGGERDEKRVRVPRGELG